MSKLNEDLNHELIRIKDKIASSHPLSEEDLKIIFLNLAHEEDQNESKQ